MKTYEDKKQITNNQLIEVQFEKLIENPIEEINRIYSLFNLGSPDTQKILQLLEKNKQLQEQKNL